uniref:Uncharacterized protein n=1 Tax=Rhizophora mucronata TaxID=61149 RepID=A0A2P2P3C1_RHIMU
MEAFLGDGTFTTMSVQFLTTQENNSEKKNHKLTNLKRSMLKDWLAPNSQTTFRRPKNGKFSGRESVLALYRENNKIQRKINERLKL